MSIVIAAGGTGGHVIPALAVADAVARCAPGARIAFIGASRGIEGELVPARGYRFHRTSMRPFGGGMRGVAALLSLVPATARARRILRTEGAHVVLGMGGYPSLPVVAAARLAHIPSLIHEQNAVPGLANRVAARLTGNVAVSFPGSEQAFPHGGRLVGSPLRPELAGLDREARRGEALASFGFDPARRTVLVLGGSIGAARLNAAAVGIAERWSPRDDVQLLVSTGPEHHAAVTGALPSGGRIRVRCEPFIDRMDLAYASADAVVSRAGGSTVAELAVAGLPSILVPYPHARRHEQDANARAVAAVGGGVVIDDADASPERITAILDDLLADDERRSVMGKAALALARPRAADEMAGWLLELARSARG